ncbi:MAG TPA: hypothetical protein VF655_12240 [Allosphingosinicella sp.]|jgi:hypothetical protein
MQIDYILTTFSPAMFGEKATAYVRVIHHDEAMTLVNESSRVVATRVSHEKLARHQFPQVSSDTQRYVVLQPGKVAIHLHYRGPQVSESGELPNGGAVSLYLIEVEEYDEPEV